MRGLRLGIAVLGLSAMLGQSASAQHFVPGGWAPNFGYQSYGIGGLNANAGYGVAGYSGIAYGGYGYGNYPGQFNMGQQFVGSSFGPPPSGMSNGLFPLAQTVRQATSRRRGR